MADPISYAELSAQVVDLVDKTNGFKDQQIDVFQTDALTATVAPRRARNLQANLRSKLPAMQTALRRRHRQRLLRQAGTRWQRGPEQWLGRAAKSSATPVRMWTPSVALPSATPDSFVGAVAFGSGCVQTRSVPSAPVSML
jgi:hypothetical protein